MAETNMVKDADEIDTDEPLTRLQIAMAALKRPEDASLRAALTQLVNDHRSKLALVSRLERGNAPSRKRYKIQPSKLRNTEERCEAMAALDKLIAVWWRPLTRKELTERWRQGTRQADAGRRGAQLHIASC